MSGTVNQLISVEPEVLKFQLELEKQSYCDLKVTNNSEHHVAFKVKTTSPKKYFVRPNTGIIHPWDSCVIKVTLQGQREYPTDFQCKDRFLVQSTIVPSHTDVDELSQDTFNDEGGKMVDEFKLRVVYISPAGPTEDEAVKDFKQGFDSSTNQTVQRLKDDIDAAVRQTHQLQQELETAKRHRNQRNEGGFSLAFTLFVGLIAIIAGFILNQTLSSSAPAPSLLSSQSPPSSK